MLRVQFSCSVVSRLFVTSWTAVCQAFLSITNSWSLLKIMSIELVIPSNHLIFCHPRLLPPSVFASIRVFSSWFDIHAIQGTLESSPTPQFKSINSALSLFYGPTLNIHIWIFTGGVLNLSFLLLRGWLVNLEHLLKCWLICCLIFLTFIKVLLY